VAPAPGLVVGDMSFISLTLVLPALVAAAAPDADFLLMVKPQFEIGKERLGHGGVVRNPEHHVETVENVARCAIGLGLDIAAIAPSPVPRPPRHADRHPITAQGAAPIVVIGTTHDPATPYTMAQGLSGQLASGVLVSVEGWSHTAYRRGANQRGVNAVEDYLVKGNVPQNGLTCQ